MKEEKSKKKKIIVASIVAVSVVGVIALIMKNRKLVFDNLDLNKRISNLEGRNENQAYLIGGLQRQNERLSYINGKLSQKL